MTVADEHAEEREAQEVDQRYLDAMRVAGMILVRDDSDIERLEEGQEPQECPHAKLKVRTISMLV